MYTRTAVPLSAYHIYVPARQEVWRSSAFVNPAPQHLLPGFLRRRLQLYRNSLLGSGRWEMPRGGCGPAERSPRGTGVARPLRREAPTAPGGGGSRSAGACARPQEAEPRRGRGSAAAAGGTGRAAGGRAGDGGKRGRRWLARLLLGPPVPRRCPAGRAAAEANGVAALSGLPSAGVGSRGQRRGGRAMPLTSLLALPFLLLLPLPALKLLFSPAAVMAGNFPEGWAQAGLALRRAPQGSGHTVRWGEASGGVAPRPRQFRGTGCCSARPRAAGRAAGARRELRRGPRGAPAAVPLPPAAVPLPGRRPSAGDPCPWAGTARGSAPRGGCVGTGRLFSRRGRRSRRRAAGAGALPEPGGRARPRPGPVGPPVGGCLLLPRRRAGTALPAGAQSREVAGLPPLPGTGSPGHCPEARGADCLLSPARLAAASAQLLSPPVSVRCVCVCRSCGKEIETPRLVLIFICLKAYVVFVWMCHMVFQTCFVKVKWCSTA